VDIEEREKRGTCIRATHSPYTILSSTINSSRLHQRVGTLHTHHMDPFSNLNPPLAHNPRIGGLARRAKLPVSTTLTLTLLSQHRTAPAKTHHPSSGVRPRWDERDDYPTIFKHDTRSPSPSPQTCRAMHISSYSQNYQSGVWLSLSERAWSSVSESASD
jgi:hypothetical protein